MVVFPNISLVVRELPLEFQDKNRGK